MRLSWACALATLGCEPPALERLELTAPGPLAPGVTLEASVYGRNLDGETAELTTWLLPELTGRRWAAERTALPLRADPEPTPARVTLDERHFALEGASHLYLEVALLGAHLESARLPLLVEPKVIAIALAYETPLGPAQVEEGQRLPAGLPLDLTVSTQLLAGRRPVRLELWREQVLLDRRQVEVQGDSERLRYAVDPSHAPGPTALRLEASEGAHPPVVLRFQAEPRGVFGCRWATAERLLLDPGQSVPRGSAVKGLIYTWGADGQEATVEIKEQDTNDDDHVATLSAPVIAGRAEVDFLADFIDDGLFDGEDEYVLLVTLPGGGSCRSPLLLVPE